MIGTCKNCGGWKGLHHFETMQCPSGGVERFPNVWVDTVYEEAPKFTEIQSQRMFDLLVELVEARKESAADLRITSYAIDDLLYEITEDEKYK